MSALRLCLVCQRAREENPHCGLCVGCFVVNRDRRGGGDRRNPKTQGWWLTGVLSRERRSGRDRRQP